MFASNKSSVNEGAITAVHSVLMFVMEFGGIIISLLTTGHKSRVIEVFTFYSSPFCHRVE